MNKVTSINCYCPRFIMSRAHDQNSRCYSIPPFVHMHMIYLSQELRRKLTTKFCTREKKKKNVLMLAPLLSLPISTLTYIYFEAILLKHIRPSLFLYLIMRSLMPSTNHMEVLCHSFVWQKGQRCAKILQSSIFPPLIMSWADLKFHLNNFHN